MLIGDCVGTIRMRFLLTLLVEVPWLWVREQALICWYGEKAMRP